MVSAAKPALVVVGSVNADLVLPIDRLPKAGETIGATSLETLPGGKGANQAAAAAKLGYPTYFVGQVGTDANAAPLKAALKEAGVLLDHLRDVPGPTGTALILLQADGENSIIIVGGANQAAWALSDGAREAIRHAGAVLLQREIPESVNVEVAQIARAAGVPVFLDAGGVEGPISHDLLRCISLLSPNETELARLAELGEPPAGADSDAQILAAAEKLKAQGVDSVLVKLGAQGSLLLPGSGGQTRQEAFKVPKVVDTTGAGDCFTAAYAVAVLEGLQGPDALRFASAAASICVQRKGAMPSLPHRAEVTALLSQ